MSCRAVGEGRRWIMAAAETTSLKEPDAVTVCPLCHQLLTDPTVLPCYHAYCVGCLQDWWQRHQADDQSALCPLCHTPAHAASAAASASAPDSVGFCTSHAGPIRYDTIRDAILTCARKPTRVSQLNLPHGNDNLKVENRKTKK